MDKQTFRAQELFALEKDDTFYKVLNGMHAAIGYRALEGNKPFVMLDPKAPEYLLSFYIAGEMNGFGPRYAFRFFQRKGHEPARCEIEIEYSLSRHQRRPVQVSVIFPDQLLGMECDGKYCRPLFNLTPGEYSANLYDPLSSVAAALSFVEASVAQPIPGPARANAGVTATV